MFHELQPELPSLPLIQPSENLKATLLRLASRLLRIRAEVSEITENSLALLN
jgi:hypothetical protein